MKNRKNTQSEKSTARTWLNFAIAFGIVALLFVIPAVSGLLFREDTAETKSVSAETTPLQPETELYEPGIHSLGKQSFDLGSGITLTEYLSVTGDYPENGVSEPMENIFCVRLRNDAERTLEYLTFDVFCDEKEYTFAVSTLPPGETVLVWEKNGQNAPQTLDNVQVAIGYQVFFREEPVVPDSLYIIPENGILSVTNVSDKDIPGEFFVYYKNRLNGEYLGGITYRVRITGGLKAGAVYNAYAPNAVKARTKVLFADDVS